MGLLSNLGNAIKKTAAAVVRSPVGKALDIAATSFVHPIQTIGAIISPTKTVSDLVKTQKAKPLKKQITETVLTTAGYGVTVVGSGVALAASKAGTIVPTAVKAFTSLSPKQKVITALAAPVVVGAVIQQPKEIAQAVASTPASLANFGGNIAELVASPSIEKAKDIYKENPILTGAAATAAAFLTAKTIAPAVGNIIQTQAIKEQTEVIKDVSKPTIIKEPVVSKDTTPALTTATTNAAPITPITAKTQPIYATTGTVTKKRSKKRSPKITNISQRTNVILQNKVSNIANRRYLNKRLLTN